MNQLQFTAQKINTQNAPGSKKSESKKLDLPPFPGKKESKQDSNPKEPKKQEVPKNSEDPKVEVKKALSE